jgi:hypothetical protein
VQQKNRHGVIWRLAILVQQEFFGSTIGSDPNHPECYIRECANKGWNADDTEDPNGRSIVSWLHRSSLVTERQHNRLKKTHHGLTSVKFVLSS